MCVGSGQGEGALKLIDFGFSKLFVEGKMIKSHKGLAALRRFKASTDAPLVVGGLLWQAPFPSWLLKSCSKGGELGWRGYDFKVTPSLDSPCVIALKTSRNKR